MQAGTDTLWWHGAGMQVVAGRNIEMLVTLACIESPQGTWSNGLQSVTLKAVVWEQLSGEANVTSIELQGALTLPVVAYPECPQSDNDTVTGEVSILLAIACR